MGSTPGYAATPRLSAGTVSVGDVTRTGTPISPVTVFTAGLAGSRIDNIDIVGVGPTTATTLRLWEYNGSTYILWQEIPVLAITPSSGVVVAQTYQGQAVNGEKYPLILPANGVLKATVNDTQIVRNDDVLSVCASQSIAANAYALLNSSVYGTGGVGVAASTVAVAAAATLGAAGYMSLTATPYAVTQPSQVSLTSTGNISAVNFTVYGTDPTGATQTETLAGPNNNTVYGVKIWASISNIFASAAVATATSAGYSSVAILPMPSKITISSSAALTGTTFTVIGTAPNGSMLTETLVGPAAGATVTSVNIYKTVTSIKASALSNPTLVGTAAIMSGINVIARGGDF